MLTILTIINSVLFLILIALIVIQILFVHIFVTYILMKIDRKSEEYEAEYIKE